MANTTNIADSVRQRLYNLAKKRGDDFQILLTRYTIERLLLERVRTGGNSS
jgi:hypothetical protein